MALQRTMKYQFAVLFLLSVSYTLCVEGNESAVKLLKGTTIFLVGLSEESLPPAPNVSCVNSTYLGGTENKLLHKVQYEEQDAKDPHEWILGERNVTFTIGEETKDGSTLTILEIYPPTYSVYLGKFALLSKEGCIIVGDNMPDNSGKQRCLIWGEVHTFDRLPRDCQKMFDEKCSDGKKITEQDFEDCN
uniref:Putative secreted protein n=1 Tax=Amblyomma americanum TaxID=6943 RepID=A0A0C9SE30_AMBAM